MKSTRTIYHRREFISGKIVNDVALGDKVYRMTPSHK
jgi:hypothetical protein